MLKLLIVILSSLLIQLSAYWANQLTASISSEFRIMVVGVFIIILSFLLKLERRWLLTNIAIYLGIIAGSLVNISGLTLLLLVLFFLIFIPTIWTRVPFYPTHRQSYLAIADLLPKNEPFHLLDAGCGDAALLLFLANKYPQAKFTGVEISPLSFITAYLSCKINRSQNITVMFKSYAKLDFGNYSHIYAFLAPPVMSSFWQKAKNEMYSGACLLINSFPLPVPATSVIHVADQIKDRSGTIFVYKI